MQTISVSELMARRENSFPMQWVDVRSSTEFSAGHLPVAMNIPMDEIEARLQDLAPERPVVLICKSGGRAGVVAGLIEPCRKDVTVLAGGTDAWAKAGLPLVVTRKTRWSLERQVRLAAGVLALTATILAATVSRDWLALAGFVGLGLTFAGISDLCPMGMLLAAMPWNRIRQCSPFAPIEGPKCL